MGHVRLGPQGRLVIPAGVRRELGLAPGDELVYWREGDRLVLARRDRALRELLGMFEGDGVVDGLIAERRAEAAREDAT